MEALQSMMTGDAFGSWVLAAMDPKILVSPWKPIVLILPIGLWAWFISTVVDKHAARWHLGRNNWNAVHMVFGVAAFFIALLAAPLESHVAFAISFVALVAILAVNIVVYMQVTNRDERVPETHRLKLDVSSWKTKKEEKAAAKQQATVELIIRRPDKSLVEAPLEETEEFRIRTVAEGLYIKAVSVRASQADLAPTSKDTYTSSYLVDGVRQGGDAIPAADAIKAIDFWKAAAKLDLADRRRQLSADVSVDKGAGAKPTRVLTSGAQGGVRLTLLFDPSGAVRRAKTDLGLTDQQANLLKEIVDDSKGVVLIASPPDGGRTTTLYTILKLHDAYTSNVQTVESDPQDALEGVRQNKYNPGAEGAEYSTLVRSILRRDPNVVGVAELPDANTAKEIVRADHDRIRCYVALQADSALAAVQKYVQAVGSPEQAGESVHGVVSQKLIRKLCVNCRVPYQPSPEMLKKLGLPAEKVPQLFKRGGQVIIKNKPETCPACMGSGYVGQMGIFEIFRLGAEERSFLKQNNLPGLKAALRKQQLPSLQQVALIRAIEGITSIEEVTRVTAEGGGGEGGAAKAAAAPANSAGKPTPQPAGKPGEKAGA